MERPKLDYAGECAHLTRVIRELRAKGFWIVRNKTQRGEGKRLMIKFELLEDIGVLVREPKNELSTDDFQEISRVIDPYIREKGKLTGLLIEAASFPGWDSFGTFVEHLKFVYGHQRNIDRVAIVTDAASLKIAPTIAQHFAHPEIRAFASLGRDEAVEWLQS